MGKMPLHNVLQKFRFSFITLKKFKQNIIIKKYIIKIFFMF